MAAPKNPKAAPKSGFTDIDDYVKGFPGEVQTILEKMRHTIQGVAPEAVEAISYQIPAFKLGGKNLVHFAAWKHHVAVYPIPPGPDASNKRMASYAGGKGTVRFPLSEPIPYDLLEELVTLRIKEVQKQK